MAEYWDGCADDRYMRLMWSPDSRKLAALRIQLITSRQITLVEIRPDLPPANVSSLDTPAYPKGEVLPMWKWWTLRESNPLPHSCKVVLVHSKRLVL